MEEPQVTPPESTAARAADALRELQAHAQAAISTRRERMSQLEANITQRIDSLAETLAAQRAAETEAAASIDETKADIGQLQAQLDQQDRELRKRADQLADLERQLKAREAVVDQRSAEFVQRDEELTQRQQELDLREHSLDRRDEEADGPASDEREAQWQVERAKREREHDELAQTVAELRQRAKSHEEGAAEWKAQRAELEAELSEQRAAVARLQSELEAANLSVESDAAKLETELAASREQRASAEQAATAARAERDEVQQKFALAHEDVQRFRARIAELEQELARRPAPDQTDTTELVALRAERDALAERLEALENQPAEPANAADAAQQADLQRRFELAVEDVRELKTLNAQLETQLAASRKHSGPATDAGGMDWESQKRRMLASLEGDDDGEPQRQHERTTIAETIQMTDAVVAEKDKEIGRLQAQLAGSASAPPTSEENQEAAINELVDADEVIQQYREKIAEQHQEMEAKLRAAELELSVERAKIARDRVELDQLKIDLDNARKNLPGGGATLTQPGPKKRWLSKLGLSGDE